jgi:hypothetical protein
MTEQRSDVLAVDRHQFDVRPGKERLSPWGEKLQQPSSRVARQGNLA